MARKTVDVSAVKELANHMLDASYADKKDGRISIAVFLERILMDTGNYKGFQFTDGAHGDLDDTRRYYY